jgi:hypothetical protein
VSAAPPLDIYDVAVSSAPCRVTALLVGLLLLAFAPGHAVASTTIGQLDPGTPTGSCLGTTYWAQNASAGPSYSAPSNGVITAWSHQAGAATGRQLGLRIFRLVSGTTYTLTGSSGVQILTASSLNSFPTRIPVKAGEKLGLYVGNPAGVFPDLGGGASCAFSGAVGDLIHEGAANPEPPVGTDTSLLVSYTGIYRLNVTAKIEPDADGDGYGDETQDACPASASSYGSCPTPDDKGKDKTPPRATVARKRNSVKDNHVSVRVTSDETGTATTTGTISVPNASKVYRLKRVTTALRRNVATKLELRIPKKARKPIARALKKRRKLRARLTIVVADAAGNTTTIRSSVSLRR